ncbi:hypothetical protein [Flavivirga algicola]|uniref:Uncharacterized protein n=1 Tax=Flavivirga algicola TaxID=2729136 RepID=A0ABX1RZU2_9FLAO|nr:hypothetical protein [Flavivirga algicola]NMH87709.1 hypothetical protein [Flavivirga algicola]
MTDVSKYFEATKKSILTELASEDYDEVEIIVRCSTDNNKGRTKIKANKYLIVNGEKSKVLKAINHNAYRELFARHHGLKVLQFKVSGENIEAFGNYPSSRDNYGMIEEFNDPEAFLEQQANMYLDAGIDYIATFYLDRLSNFNINPFGAYQKGKRLEVRHAGLDMLVRSNLMFLAVLQCVVPKIGSESKVKVILRKDKPIEIICVDIKTIINDILVDYNFYYGEKYEIDCNVSYREGSYKPVNLIFNGELTLNGEKKELERFPKEDLTILYSSLEQKVDQLRLTIKNGKLSIASNISFPAYNIELLRTNNYNVAADNLHKICEFIESGNEEKMLAAVEAACQLETSKNRIEARYLNYIKAQSLNKGATLFDIRPEMFDKNIQNICSGRFAILHDESIHFGMKNEEETKQIIDFIGANVDQNINVSQFIKSIEGVFSAHDHINESMKSLVATHHIYRQQLAQGFKEEAKLHPNGWWSEACIALSNIKMNTMTIDSTRFYREEKLPYLVEYMSFLLIILSGEKVHIDIYNSQMHELTTLYWMFRPVPSITWFQTRPTYSNYKFAHELSVKYRINNGDLEKLDISKYRN